MLEELLCTVAVTVSGADVLLPVFFSIAIVVSSWFKTTLSLLFLLFVTPRANFIVSLSVFSSFGVFIIPFMTRVLPFPWVSKFNPISLFTIFPNSKRFASAFLAVALVPATSWLPLSIFLWFELCFTKLLEIIPFSILPVWEFPTDDSGRCELLLSLDTSVTCFVLAGSGLLSFGLETACCVVPTTNKTKMNSVHCSITSENWYFSRWNVFGVKMTHKISV